jgi:heme ABC exporter ATP-binding subunit CcmA
MSKISSVKVDAVTKLFGEVRALFQVSLTVEAGEALALMGANGAGKSTLLGLLSLGMRPTRGAVLFNGAPARASEAGWRGRVGLLSHDPLLYPDLSARANLAFFAKLYGIENAPGRVDEIVTSLDLTEFAASRPTRLLSRGQLQRVSLARALLSAPDLLLLDEPAAGLDRDAVDRIEAAVKALTERGGIAVMVTHSPEVAMKVANRAVMMRRAKIVTDGPAPASVDAWRKLYLAALRGGAR